jgi:hypothetical protein
MKRKPIFAAVTVALTASAFGHHSLHAMYFLEQRESLIPSDLVGGMGSGGTTGFPEHRP